MSRIREVLDELEQKYQYSSVIENNNRIWKRKKWLSIIICLLLDIIIVLFIINKAQNLEPMEGFNKTFSVFYSIIGVFLITFTDIVVLAIVYSKRNVSFEKDKVGFIKECLEKTFINVEYIPEGNISQYIYKEAKYKDEMNIYNSNDLIKVSDETSIDIAEVETIFLNSKSDRITEFCGLFSKSIINKSINSELRIMCGNSNYYDDKSKVNVTFSEFSNKFDIYSTNNIIAMQILTPEVIEEITSLYNNMDYAFDITLINNSLYIRIHFSDVFEFEEYDRERMIKLVNSIQGIIYLNNYINDIVNKVEI